MKSILVSSILILTCFSCKNSHQETVTFDQLLASYTKTNYEMNPLLATREGINDYNHQINNYISPEYLKKYITINQAYLDSLEMLDSNGLNESEQLSMQVLSYKLSQENKLFNAGLIWESFSIYRPVNQFQFSFPQQFAVLASGTGYIPFHTEDDYRNFMQRMHGFDKWIDQAISNMRDGLTKNNTNPKVTMSKILAQLKPLFATDTINHLFLKPLKMLPDGMDDLSSTALESDYKKAVKTVLKPAYKKLHDFLMVEYIPNLREEAGLIQNADGKTEYAIWLNYYTDFDVTPDQIFNMGLKEVERIRKEMDSLKTSVGFSGTLPEFFDYINADQKFKPFKTKDEVIKRYESFLIRMEPFLKSNFNLTPKAKFEVRVVEPFREATANAHYMPPTSGNPGVFYEAVSDPLKYNEIYMEALFLHEAIPGHHFQMAIQQELDIPAFRKSYWTTAFGEGWALYIESLGAELGLYEDPYQYMGRLSNEMERAIRQVVDPGIHGKGWTRDQAIAYILENQPISRAGAEQKVDRYIVRPGQAVSYKFGEQKILEWRKKAQQQLDGYFDIKAFHDVLLKNGCLPMNIMEKQVEKWIMDNTRTE